MVQKAGILTLSIFILFMALSPGIHSAYQLIKGDTPACCRMASSTAHNACKMACCNTFGNCCCFFSCMGIAHSTKGFKISVPQSEHKLYVYDSKLDIGVQLSLWQPPEIA